MQVLVTGGSGLTGPAIVAELIAAGHTVAGLARSDDAARLQGLGAQTLEQLAERLSNPFLARAFATDAPVSSTRTQSLLGWTPSHATLLADMANGDYFAS